MELADRHVVVTGAGSGIGRALARRFAAEGARAVVVADLDEAAAEAVADSLEGAGATVGTDVSQDSVERRALAVATDDSEDSVERRRGLAVRTDVSQEDSIKALVQRAVEAFGPIDLFCSNAGVPGPSGGPEVADEGWQRTWEINTMAHVWAARALLPDMLARGEGYLLSTASAAGLLTQVGAMPYTVAKHAAVAVAEWLAITYGDAGIKVSCLCPQGVRTPMLDDALEDPVGAAPLIAEGLLEPEEVAEAVVAGIRAEQFLILPHAAVARHMALKAAQPERWLGGMRKLVRQARAGPG